jgi:hypothetical protein
MRRANPIFFDVAPFLKRAGRVGARWLGSDRGGGRCVVVHTLDNTDRHLPVALICEVVKGGG